MNIVCFISGSGTNYREIVNRDPHHNYIVFTNRPECVGAAIARQNRHQVVSLSHVPYLKELRNKYGHGNVPRNCPERLAFEQDAVKLIENTLDREPDLICLAGYDLLYSDWMVDKYYPRMINVHPGDTTRGYVGLHRIPAAKAIIAGEPALRSTVLIVEKEMDTGPVLAQSAPVPIQPALAALEAVGQTGLTEGLQEILSFIETREINSYDDFIQKASPDLSEKLDLLCGHLQDALKVGGDWKVYPFAVHDLIARGRVELDGRRVFVDGRELSDFGYRLDINF